MSYKCIQSLWWKHKDRQVLKCSKKFWKAMIRGWLPWWMEGQLENQSYKFTINNTYYKYYTCQFWTAEIQYALTVYRLKSINNDFLIKNPWSQIKPYNQIYLYTTLAVDVTKLPWHTVTPIQVRRLFGQREHTHPHSCTDKPFPLQHAPPSPPSKKISILKWYRLYINQ